MKLLRFEFDCSRQVPWYGYLCNQYLNYQPLNITIGLQQLRAGKDNTAEPQQPALRWRYLLEAEGEQIQLEALAEQVAADFLLSMHLLDSRLQLVDSRQGTRQPIATDAPQLPFCQHCQPQFGDNQHPQFAELTLPCSHCHGEQPLLTQPKVAALQRQDLQQLAMRLLEGETLFLDDVDGKLVLSRHPIGTGRQQLLCCNPNSLNSQFQLSDSEVLALSSMEKPLLLLRPQPNVALTAPLYEVAFAATRLQQVLAEMLRVKGIDTLYCRVEGQRPLISPMLGMDIPLLANRVKLDQQQLGQALVEPLHEDARFGDYVSRSQGSRQQLQLSAQWDKSSTVWDSTDSALAAECALRGLSAETQLHQQLGLLYFSDRHGGRILTADDKGELKVFMELPSLPLQGAELLAALEASPQAPLFAKFFEQHADIKARLAALALQAIPANSLQALWSVAAVFMGIPGNNANELNDGFIAAAMSNHSANAPRIDYPLVSGTDHASINWCKALSTLVSFRLAGDDDSAKLAFAMVDSLADFIANWIERLDLNIGLKRVFLAGSSFANPVLGRRIALRLGKNFALGVSQQQDLDGALLAIGALYLRQRRR